MKKILLVEDETVLSDVYRSKLSKENFKVFSSSTVKEGLKLAKKEKPDLILLDMVFPEQDGIFFLKELRENNETAKIIVIVFSNYSDIKLKQDTFELGAKDYLIKADYTPKEIVEKVKKYII